MSKDKDTRKRTTKKRSSGDRGTMITTISLQQEHHQFLRDLGPTVSGAVRDLIEASRKYKATQK